jgi:hypothetical protein
MPKKTKRILIIVISFGVIFGILLFSKTSQQEDYSQLIDNNEYQVFLFKSQIAFPLSFAVHPWFVVNNKGEISRWEVWGFSKKRVAHWGHLYRNILPPFQGVRKIFLISDKFHNQSKLIGMIEGEEAIKIINFIKNSPENYPFKERYVLLGPNSNTYAEWVIRNFPESNLKLPWNAFGKNYEYKFEK